MQQQAYSDGITIEHSPPYPRFVQKVPHKTDHATSSTRTWDTRNVSSPRLYLHQLYFLENQLGTGSEDTRVSEVPVGISGGGRRRPISGRAVIYVAQRYSRRRTSLWCSCGWAIICVHGSGVPPWNSAGFIHTGGYRHSKDRNKQTAIHNCFSHAYVKQW